MVAYSFKPIFVPKIVDGTKRQTIRAIGKRRHARPGEEIQCYTGMRTKQCKLIARVMCDDIGAVTLSFERPHEVRFTGKFLSGTAMLNHFARCDGFESWASLVAFWRHEHGTIDQFEGVLITWVPR